METELGEIPQETFAVAFEGTAQANCTVPLNEFVPVTVIVVVPLWPTLAMLTELGLLVTVKFGPETTPIQALTRLEASMLPRPVV